LNITSFLGSLEFKAEHFEEVNAFWTRERLADLVNSRLVKELDKAPITTCDIDPRTSEEDQNLAMYDYSDDEWTCRMVCFEKVKKQ
jgi:hypothetical protein